MPSLRRFQQFRSELAKQVLGREAAKSECSASFGMAEIVESRGQIQIADKSTGSCPYEIRYCKSVGSGISYFLAGRVAMIMLLMPS